MKLVAITTIHRSATLHLAPGAEFEAPDAEAALLIEAGAARRKTIEVVDDTPVGSDGPVAGNAGGSRTK